VITALKCQVRSGVANLEHQSDECDMRAILLGLIWILLRAFCRCLKNNELNYFFVVVIAAKTS
jgi:hypothetical protein